MSLLSWDAITIGRVGGNWDRLLLGLLVTGIAWFCWVLFGMTIFVSIISEAAVKSINEREDLLESAQRVIERYQNCRPKLSLEIVPGNIAAQDRPDCVFILRNVGLRPARDVQFKPIVQGNWILKPYCSSTLTPSQQSGLNFHVYLQGIELPQRIGSLLRFLSAYPHGGTIVTCEIEVTLLDLSEEVFSDKWILECSMPSRTMRITPYIAAEPRNLTEHLTQIRA